MDSVIGFPRRLDVDNALRRSLDLVFALVLLLYTTQMEIPFFAATMANGDRRDNVIPMNTLLYVVTGLVVLTRWRGVLTTVLRVRGVLVLVVWAFLSCFWSTRPSNTLHLAVSLSLTTLSGIYLAVAFRPRQQVLILRVVTGAVIVFSLAKIGLGSSAFHHHAFRGVFTTKNEMGRLIVLAIMVFLVGGGDSRKQTLRWLTIAGLFGLLVITKSATALGIGCIMLALMPIFRLARTRGPMLLPVLMLMMSVLMSAAFFAINNTEGIFAILDRDTTMTGRTELWEAVVHSISRRPWLGYGLGGFWQRLSGPSLEVLQKVRWDVPHSHNGFLELALNLGLIGLGIFLVSYASSLLGAVRYLRQVADPYAAWPVAFMAFISLYNLTETTIVRVASIFWITYIAVVASVARESSLDNIASSFRIAYVNSSEEQSDAGLQPTFEGVHYSLATIQSRG